jgi:hypothetical protein
MLVSKANLAAPAVLKERKMKVYKELGQSVEDLFFFQKDQRLVEARGDGLRRLQETKEGPRPDFRHHKRDGARQAHRLGDPPPKRWRRCLRFL